jgi:hypothetical protein
MSATNSQANCPRCSSTLPATAKFCPQCGNQVTADETVELLPDPALERVPTDARELPPPASARPAASVHRAERRPLGMAPLPFLAGLTLGALVLAAVLGATVGWIPGVGLLAVAGAMCGLLVAGMRRQPESPMTMLLAGLVVRLRDLSGFAVSCGRTWSRTLAQVLSLRWRRLRLERDLRHLMAPLGEAVHRGDAARVEELGQEAAALQRRLAELGSREAAVVSSAQSEMERDRVPVQSTEVFAPVGQPVEPAPGRRTSLGA